MDISTSSHHQHVADGLGRGALYAMAVASGVAVANIYYNQPMLGIIETDLGRTSVTGLVPTATQLGYALGLFFLLPFGDIVHRRKLIIGQFIVLGAALAVAAIAPSAWFLVGASLLVGASATVAQQIVPFAASLARPEKRGSTIGTVMAGVLSGILFSRTLSGFVGQHAGWREMFWISVPLSLAAAVLMFFTLPEHRPTSRMHYHRAIASLAHLWSRHRQLRTAALMQAALSARSRPSGQSLHFISRRRASIWAQMSPVSSASSALSVFLPPPGRTHRRPARSTFRGLDRCAADPSVLGHLRSLGLPCRTDNRRDRSRLRCAEHARFEPAHRLCTGT